MADLKFGFSLATMWLLCYPTYAEPLANGKSSLQKSSSSKASVKETMSEFFVTLSHLLPLVVDKSAFENPKNAKILSQDMRHLANLTSGMKREIKKFADNDPSIGFLMEKFENDMQYAIDMWDKGDRIIPRTVLRGVSNYCVSCHTRSPRGASFSDMTQSPSFKRLPALTKAEYLAATRQFDAALSHYEHVLMDSPLAKADPQSWIGGIRKMLAISVRVQDNPSTTLALVNRIGASSSLMPEFMADVAAWREAAKSWASDSSHPTEDQAILKKVHDLETEANQVAGSVPRGAIIQHLRISALLHEPLSRSKQGASRQEMLLMAARSAEYLADLNLWTMQDVYLEACIRNEANLSIARQCHSELARSFVKSSGVGSVDELPVYLKNHLDSLRVN